MEPQIFITDHAKERFRERWKDGGEIHELTRQAFREGKFLNSGLRKTTRLLGYNLKGYWTATYKVYQKFVFVFQPDGLNKYILSTLFSERFLKDRRIEMIKDYENKINRKRSDIKYRRRAKRLRLQGMENL